MVAAQDPVTDMPAGGEPDYAQQYVMLVLRSFTYQHTFPHTYPWWHANLYSLALAFGTTTLCVHVSSHLLMVNTLCGAGQRSCLRHAYTHVPMLVHLETLSAATVGPLAPGASPPRPSALLPQHHFLRYYHHLGMWLMESSGRAVWGALGCQPRMKTSVEEDGAPLTQLLVLSYFNFLFVFPLSAWMRVSFIVWSAGYACCNE